jgi:hypothetical protein
MKTLYLTLKRFPFILMSEGVKKMEFRKPSKWIKSRLLNKNGTFKHYDQVHFRNGYGNDKPYFTCKFIRTDIVDVENDAFNYTLNGKDVLSVEVKRGDFIIFLGEITSFGCGGTDTDSFLKNLETLPSLPPTSPR